MENVHVEGEFGRKPTVAFTDAQPSDELLIEVLRAGDGQEVEPGDTIEKVMMPNREIMANLAIFDE